MKLFLHTHYTMFHHNFILMKKFTKKGSFNFYVNSNDHNTINSKMINIILLDIYNRVNYP